MKMSATTAGILAVMGCLLIGPAAVNAEEMTLESRSAGGSDYVIESDDPAGAARYMVETAAHAIEFGSGIGADMAAARERLGEAKAALEKGRYEDAANLANEALGQAEGLITGRQLDMARDYLFEIYTLRNQHGVKLTKDDQYEISVIRDAMDKRRAEFAMRRAKALLEVIRARAPYV